MAGVVVDNLLCYLSNKVDIIAQDTLVQLCASTYDENEIRQSRDVLYELCQSASRMLKRQGPKMKEQTLDDMIKLLHEMGDDVPKFAAVDLNRLPPISFNNLDLSALLNKMEKACSDVLMLTESCQKQVQINENLQESLASLGRRVNELEMRRKDVPQMANPTEMSRPVEFDVDATMVKTVNFPVDDSSTAMKKVEVPPSGAVENTLFSELVSKLGEWQEVQGKKNKRKPRGITGTGKSDLKIVRPKRLANVFASRFDPLVTVEELKGYLEQKTDLEVEVEKVKTRFDTYSSFHVKCRCDDPEIFMDHNNWPEKAFVRWWRESKPKGATGGLAVLTNKDGDQGQ